MVIVTLVGEYPPLFKNAFRGLRSRQIDADLLMTVAIFAATGSLAKKGIVISNNVR
jgi:cation transport ATPase